MNEQAKAIKTREDFCIFLDNVLIDLRVNKMNWENDNLEKYLGALAQFAKDFDGYRIHNPVLEGEDPSWKTFGEMLAAAIVYE